MEEKKYIKEKYLEKILNNINEGIHVVNEKGETVIYNKKMAELEDMEKDSVVGEKILDIFPSLDEENSTLLQTLVEGKEIHNKQQEYLNKYGQKIITINSTIPIEFDDGNRWALEIAKDITEIKNLYNKINKLQDKLYNNEDFEEDENDLYTFSDIKGENKKLKKVIKYARQAAKTDSSILIVGETGTGKELFAQSIHNESERKENAFIAQNCAALPENLLEGILFGTRKGGFTGAVNRNGLFEQANGGTLLLDEINSMSPTLQAKLLRVLQTNKIRPIGGDEEIKVDVRIIATTNTPPIKAIRNGDLREDLYYRLAVVLLYLPLLKEREDDIWLLSNYFIDKFNKKFSSRVKGLSEDALKLFEKYEWPGNVRQLEHVIEGAINIIARDGYIKKEHIEPFLINIEEEENSLKDKNIDKEEKLPDMIDKYEKEIIIQSLKENDGNVTKTAESLGIKRQSLQYRIDKYNIQF